MNAQEYIDSGVLELYVLGTLSEEEEREVEKRAAEHPEIEAEIQAIQETLAQYALANPKEPPRDLRARVLDAIDAENDETARDEPAVEGGRPVAVEESRTVLPALGGPSRRGRYLLAASWILLGVSLAAAVVFGLNWRSAEQQVVSLQGENAELAREVASLRDQVGHARQAMAMLGNPGFRIALMKGTAHAPQSQAVVYWHPGSKEVHVAPHNLPAPQPDKQYQLWAIHGNKRVDAGVLGAAGNDAGIQRLKQVDSADAFAVTLEPAGGRPAPSLDQIYAVGNL